MSSPSSITFVSLPPRVGRAVTRTVTQESDLTLAPTMPDGTTATIEYSSRSTYKRREEPLRVDNDVCVRQQVSYLSDHSETNVEGRVEEIANPVTGRTFIIERRREAVDVPEFASPGPWRVSYPFDGQWGAKPDAAATIDRVARVQDHQLAKVSSGARRNLGALARPRPVG